MNDRSIDTTLHEVIPIKNQKTLEVFENNIAFLLFDIPSSVDHSWDVDLNLTTEQIEILTVTLICFSLLLLIVPELIYLDDIFVTGFARMNTVFKLYFQSWIIFSIASGLVLGISLNLKFFAGVFTNHLVNFWGISTSVVLLILFYYTIVAPINKFQKPYVKTLDGVEYLKNQSFNEYEAINFVSKNITEIDGIVEAVGNDYSDYGRISSFTGVAKIQCFTRNCWS